MTTPHRAWETVYRAIKDEIARGDEGALPPGEPIENEHALAERYEVSRNSVRTAMARLESEGVVEPGGNRKRRRVRAGNTLYWHLSRFEVGERRDDPDTGQDEWSADMREQGRTPRQEVSVRPMRPTGEIADAMHVGTDEWLFRRRRIRYADNLPVTIADTWITDQVAKRSCVVDGTEVFPFLEERDVTVTGGIFNAVGLPQRRARHVITARPPTEDEAALLDIPTVGVAVSEHTLTGYDSNGDPIRTMISISPGTRLSLVYEMDYPTH